MNETDAHTVNDPPRTAGSRIAFKEWGAVCEALRTGRQIAIFRKGGIDEGREGFRVEHNGVWLFPTYEHQSAEKLAPEAGDLLAASESARDAGGRIPLQLWAEVTDVVELREPDVLPRLTGRHIYTPQTLDERFHYRRPGLFVLLVRIYQRAEPFLMPDSPHFAGCRSWVELPDDVSTAGAQAVLSDEEFAARRQELKAALAPTGMA